MHAEIFTTNSDDFKSARYDEPPVTSDVRKTVKLGHLMTRFSSMPFVTQVASGTVDVKISAAAKAVVKACKVQNGY